MIIIQPLFILFNSIRSYEYDLLIWISNHHNIILNKFFFLGTLLGSELFYMLLIPFIFAFLDSKKASTISTFILFSLLLNSILKLFFLVQRPDSSIVETLYPSLAEGFSFPSGHAQGSITLWGITAYHLKNDVKKIIFCVFMILWVSLSRIYLCVHFPADIIAGWFFGLLIVIFYILINKKTKKIPHLFLICFFTALIIIFNQPRIIKICSVLCGIHIGIIFLPKNFSYTTKMADIKLKLFIIFTGSGFIYICFEFFNSAPFLKYGLIGFWLSFMYPYAIARIPSFPFRGHN